MKTISRTAWTYLLRETLLILLLTYFLLFTGASGVLSSHDLLTGSAVLFLALCAGWFIAGQRAPIPLARPLLFFLAAFLLSTLVSIDPRRSLSQLVLTAAGLTLFAFAADAVARGWPAELWVKALLVAGAFLMLTTWFDFFNWYRGWLQAEPGQWLPRIIYRPSKANILAYAVNTLFFLSAARLLYTRAWFPRLILALYSFSALVIVYLTSSRGAWLGAAGGFAALALLLLYRERARLLALWAALRRRPALLVSFAFLLFALLPVAYALVARQLNHPTHPAFWQARAAYWGPAWQTFLKHPLLGQGPFTYASTFMATGSIPPDDIFFHGHSTPLNLLGEMGLLGFAAFTAVLVALVRALKRRFDSSTGLELSVVLGVILAAAALAIQSVFDCFHTEPVAVIGLLVALGAALGAPPTVPAQTSALNAQAGKDIVRSQSAPQPAQSSTLNAQAGVLAGHLRPFWLILPALLVFFEVWSTAPLARGVTLANTGDWPAAVAALTAAARRDPGSVIAHQQLALAQAILAKRSETVAVQPAPFLLGKGGGIGLPAAIAAMQRAVDLDPAYAPHHLNLGALLAAAGDLPAALVEYRTAVRLAPRWGLAHLNLGLAAELAGDLPAARAAYTAALADPTLSPAPFWQATPLRAALYADWLAQQSPSPCEAPCKGLGEGQGRGMDSLRAQAAAFPQYPGFYLDLAAAELAADHLPEARRALALGRATWSTNPAEHLEFAWLDAALVAASGDLSTAAALGDRALRSALAQGVNGPGSFGYLTYAPFEFRRPAMAVELVPQLTTIPLTDAWAARAETLAGWYIALGMDDQAASIDQMTNRSP